MNSIELFAGAGGLAMGVAASGFRHRAVIEWDRFACDTLRQNQSSFLLGGSDPIEPTDARTFDYSRLKGSIDLVAGGPPCQPFSLGGKHKGHADSRDMFPEAIRAIRELRPRAFIFENVRGLARQSFFNYFQYIKLQLEFPEIEAIHDEDWTGHLKRLESHKTSGTSSGLQYQVVSQIVNAANYGVPQKRERVVIVGFRADLSLSWSFPVITHAEESLLYTKWVTGDYWELHEVAKRDRPDLTARFRELICKRVSDLEPSLMLSPWKTVRDAVFDLPEPEESENPSIPNHRFQSGAKTYPGHTGSPIDEPAKTLKAGDHGVPGGENMVRLNSGAVRYFSVRESARLQTFPDDFIFHGTWSENMRQLGNAVPVELGRVVASSVAARLVAA